MRRPLEAWSLLLLLLLLLPMAPAAGAAERTVVARAGEVELTVRDHHDDLCVDLRDPATPDLRYGCKVMPLSHLESETRIARVPGRSLFGGVVPADRVAAVELEYANGARLRAATEGTDLYRGRHRGRVTFFLIDTTSVTGAREEWPVLLRHLDAEGRLVGASKTYGNPVSAGPVMVPDAGTKSSVAAVMHRRFRPSPLQLDRTQEVTCLVEGPCVANGPFVVPIRLSAGGSCGRDTNQLRAFVGPQVVRVVVTLGSGRRVELATHELPGLGTVQRAVAARFPLGEAVRGAVAYDGAGRVVARERIEIAPTTRRCPKRRYGSHFGTSLTALTSTSPGSQDGREIVMGTPAGPHLVARDHGEYLCVNVDELAADRHDCSIPLPPGLEPPYPGQPPVEGEVPLALAVRSAGGYTAAGGLLPPHAARARVHFTGAGKTWAAISDGTAYTGRYRGHVRFFLAHVPGRRKVFEVELFDAAGKRLESLWRAYGAGSVKTSTILSGPGYRLFAGRVAPGLRDRYAGGFCLGLLRAGERPTVQACDFSRYEQFLGRVSCATRRGVMIGDLTHGLRGVRLELAGGGSIRSRTVRIPKAWGGGRVWVLELPSGTEGRRLRFLGRRDNALYDPPRPHSGPYVVRPPRRQCGYELRAPEF